MSATVEATPAAVRAARQAVDAIQRLEARFALIGGQAVWRPSACRLRGRSPTSTAGGTWASGWLGSGRPSPAETGADTYSWRPDRRHLQVEQACRLCATRLGKRLRSGLLCQMNTGLGLAFYGCVKRKMPMNHGKHDMKIPPSPDHPVTQLTARELVPVTRLVSETEVTVINGVLTVVRVLKAA